MELAQCESTLVSGIKSPIDDYYQGMPCMLGSVVGRIVGESEVGSWGDINGLKVFSNPLFATPHGTIMKTGVMHLSKITTEGSSQLSEYERVMLQKGEELYGGYLAGGLILNIGGVVASVTTNVSAIATRATLNPIIVHGDKASY